MRSKENEDDANLNDHLEGTAVRSQGTQSSLGALTVPDQGRFHSPAQGYDQRNEEGSMDHMPPELIVNVLELVRQASSLPDYHPVAMVATLEYFRDCLADMDNMSAPLRVCTGQTFWVEGYSCSCQGHTWRCDADWQ